MIKLDDADVRRSALLMMHFQADVFSLIPAEAMPGLLDRANELTRVWRQTGRPVVFADFVLGANYESVNLDNLLVTNISRTGYFREAAPAAGPDIAASDRRYACPRASVFYSTTLDADLREEGIDTLFMAGIASSGVLFSTIGWASDADYRIFVVRDCCYDPDAQAHDALFRTSFATRARIL